MKITGFLVRSDAADIVRQPAHGGGCRCTGPLFLGYLHVRLDLQGLLADPSALLRVAVFLFALLLIRGLPALLYLPDLGRNAAIATVSDS